MSEVSTVSILLTTIHVTIDEYLLLSIICMLTGLTTRILKESKGGELRLSRLKA